MAPENETDETAAEPKPKRSSGNLIVILCGVAVMILAPLSSFVVVKMTQPSTQVEKPPAEEAHQAPITYELESLVVNVKGTRMTRVLRLQPYLVLSDATLQNLMQELDPVIKDSIMSVASQRTLEELETAEDRKALKRDIRKTINTLIRDRQQGSILDVGFSDFLIQ